MLFIDYSSAFNTIVPSKLVIKLETLGFDPTLCSWVLDFLTGHPQVVRVGNNFQFCGNAAINPWFLVGEGFNGHHGYRITNALAKELAH